jgi:PAS domain S-box-containing protein
VDIRTKLVFALVAVALGSMTAFGAFMYAEARGMVDEGTRAQLESLAESEAQAVENIIEGWRERVQLIASRTQLRMSLRDYNQTGDPEAARRIRQILRDASKSSRSVAALAVYDVEGRLVADGVGEADSVLIGMSTRSSPVTTDEIVFRGVSLTPDGLPQVAYSRNLSLEGERLGTLFVLLNGQRLVDLTQDYIGLGETGEVLIVEGVPGSARTLHAVRHQGDDDERTGAILLDGPQDPALLALRAQEDIYTEDMIDYRGEAVWAATRFIPSTNWGLVVKVDAAEKRFVIVEFRDSLIALALSLAGIAILVAVVLGFRFAGPIHNLAEAANRIREGDLEARAEVLREDEIGLLAETFNRMADELEERVAELHEFKKFFEVSPEMLCIAGTDGYFKRANPAFSRILGWGDEQLLGHPFYDLVHPDDLEATQQEIEKLSRGIATISFVNRFRCEDGSYKCLRWNSYPEPETGLLYAIAREIEDPQAS